MSDTATLEPEVQTSTTEFIVSEENLTEDEGLYEIIDGLRMEKIISNIELRLALVLAFAVEAHTKANNLGRAFTELLIDMGVNNNNRRPDMAYISFDRLPASAPYPTENAWSIVPELVAEIISKTNTVDHVLEKIHEYFEAGVQTVWIVHPRFKQIYVYESPTQNIILGEQDELSDESLFPGWRFPVADLFVF